MVGLVIGFMSRMIKALQKANTEIKRLEGIIPICAGCKKIRDEEGIWNHLEAFVEDHTDAQISHRLCPDCLEKYSPFPVHEDK